MELKGKKMNVIGDSITQGVGVKDKKNTFVNRLYVNEGFEIVLDLLEGACERLLDELEEEVK